MIEKCCAICGECQSFTIVYPARISAEKIDADVFSARRTVPQKAHYRMVRCDTCGLLRSSPVFSEEELADLYLESKFTYVGEVANLKKTYGRYLRRLETFGVHKGRILEIGCGNGFFLEEARAQGYKEVYGAEPSRDAVANADPIIRPHIRQEMFRAGMFPENYFDVICLFQTLDHLFEPRELIGAGRVMLKPGGFFLVLNHNEKAVSARILGERSPIIDIEHTNLFNTRTVRSLFEAEKCNVKEAGGAWNVISFSYLTDLLPMPLGVKKSLHGLLQTARIGNASLSLPIGNLYCIAQK